MKQRKPPKGRNMVAKALQCKIFAPKTVPAKKGRGTVYTRKGRSGDNGSGLYLFWARGSADFIFGI